LSGLSWARRVRFGFWGAEERGLVGSRHHLAQQSEADHQATILYIKLDMVGSPNFGRFVEARGEELKGVQAIAARALLSFFHDRNLPVQERFGGRARGFGSDDGSFAQKGIPTLGLYTGAGETKDGVRASLFGGRAETPYDPCYHKACDTLTNINVVVLREMQEALMSAILAVATTNDTPAAE
jgi:Zn-dependent M28 family amino/carboxypeptidase